MHRFPGSAFRVLTGPFAAGILISACGQQPDTGPAASVVAPASSPTAAVMTPEQARADTGPIYASGCYANREDVTPPGPGECLYGDPAGRRIVLFGDSHAAQWFSAMLGAAEAAGWRLLPVVKAACPPGAAPVYNAHLEREYTECAQWRERALARIAAEDPDLVVVATRAGYYRAMGPSRPLSVADSAPVLRDGLAADLRRFADLGARTLLVRDTPVPGFHVPDCVADAGGESCPYVLADALPEDSHQVAAAEQGGTPIVDLNEEVCGDPADCRTIIDGVITFRDDDHLGATFSATLAPVLGQRVAAVG